MFKLVLGCGLHVSYLSKHFPRAIFQPSEYEVNMFKSIKEYSKDCSNVQEPIFVDISQDLDLWTSKFDNKLLRNCTNTFDFILNINMIHITSFECSIGLFTNCSLLLKSKGFLFTYGPYSSNNVLTPESNVLFDKSLREQNSSWGIRDIQDLKALAENNSMELFQILDLPSNNKLLVWKKN